MFLCGTLDRLRALRAQEAQAAAALDHPNILARCTGSASLRVRRISSPGLLAGGKHAAGGACLLASAAGSQSH